MKVTIHHLRYVKKILYENGLSIVLGSIFLVILIGQFAVGLNVYNQNQMQHGQGKISSLEYIHNGHFIEAVFENWESEFLQMFAYILITVFLRQKGSSESKQLDESQSDKKDIAIESNKNNLPWPARKGGLMLSIYKNSLSLAFFLLFLIAFLLHGFGGVRVFNEEQVEHGEQKVTMLVYMKTSQFWFESLQNWQSEFLAVFLIVVLSIHLRQQGSPESKPVFSPNNQTGSS